MAEENYCANCGIVWEDIDFDEEGEPRCPHCGEYLIQFEECEE